MGDNIFDSADILDDDDRKRPIMLKILDDYDWEHAFEYAGDVPEYGYLQGGADIRTIIGHEVSAEPFTREDVTAINLMYEGENDSRPWLMLGRLKDGRYFALSAWCDYTGWDCQAGGTVFVAPTEALALEYGFDADERARLHAPRT